MGNGRIYQKIKWRMRRIRAATSEGLVRISSVILGKLARATAHQEFANKGNGDNRARLPFAAQPWALRVGDQLVTGDFVLEPPREGFNGRVVIKITGGHNGHEISLPSRIPVAIWPSLKS